MDIKVIAVIALLVVLVMQYYGINSMIMKHITKLLILIFSSLLFSGELEVDGDLKVSGSVESTTIDSLKAVIVDLQAQLEMLQLQIEFKIGYIEFFVGISDTVPDGIHFVDFTAENIPNEYGHILFGAEIINNANNIMGLDKIYNYVSTITLSYRTPKYRYGPQNYRQRNGAN